MSLADINGFLQTGLLAVGGYLVYQWYTGATGHVDPTPHTNPILPGGQPIPDGSQGGFLEYEPDTVYPDHLFHATVLDPWYDWGWSSMQWLREHNAVESWL